MMTDTRDDTLMSLLGGLLVNMGIRASRADLENAGKPGKSPLREEDDTQDKEAPDVTTTSKDVPEEYSIEVTYFPVEEEETVDGGADILNEDNPQEDEDDEWESPAWDDDEWESPVLDDEGVEGPVGPQELPDPAWHGEGLPKDFESIARRQIEVYRKKNSDYGGATHKLYCEYGLVYYLIMLEQKMLRLKSLVGKKNLKGLEPNYESLEESLLDMSNYALLAVESLRKGKNEE